MITISIVNQSTVLTNAQVKPVVKALQRQLDNHFLPHWGITANLVYVPQASTPNPYTWWLVLLDDSDQAGALGYHDLTPTGLPLGKIFVKTDQQFNLSWTVTASHELLEMMMDPDINLTTFVQSSNTAGYLYAYEMCDPCLTGDTKIDLLDGTCVNIESLVDRQDFWVYSCDKSGNIVPGHGHSARKTGVQKDVYRITLDNDKTIDCTDNHRFLMRDGTYKEAKELIPTDSLMPLYKEQRPISPKKVNSTYETIYNPATDSWVFTHRMVQPICPKNYVRHHVDFNRYNNSPENIKIMKWDDHTQLHKEHIFKTMLHPDVLERTREDKSERMIKLNQSHKGQKRPELCVKKTLTEKQRIACGQRGKIWLKKYNKTEEHRAIAAINGAKSLLKLWTDSEFRERKIQHASNLFTNMNNQEWHKELMKQVHQTSEFKQAASQNASLQNHIRWHEKRNVIKDNCNHCVVNHKVVSINYLGKQDVYDISVDDYHNFAVSAGVFVHNCEDDSFAYEIYNVKVSDFVLPAYFQSAIPATQWDFGGHLTGPAPTLATGGYISEFPVGQAANTGWTQVNAELAPSVTNRATRNLHGSRRHKRATDKSQWKLSTVTKF